MNNNNQVNQSQTNQVQQDGNDTQVAPVSKPKPVDPYESIEVDLKSLLIEEPDKEQDEPKNTSDDQTTKSEQGEQKQDQEGQPEKQQQQEGQEEGQEKLEQKEPETEPELPKIKVADKELTEEEILEALKDSENKKKWQKENTQKAQEVAELRKVAEPLVEFVKLVKNSPDLIEILEDTLIEADADEKIQKAFKTAFTVDIDKYRSPYLDELEKLKEEKERIEAERAFNEDAQQLKQKYKLKDSDIDEIVQYAENRYKESGVVLTLEEAYKALDYDRKVKELERLKKEQQNRTLQTPKTVEKNVGATQIKTPPKKIRDYEEIDLGEFKDKLFTGETTY